MNRRLITVPIEIPKVEGIEDLFKGVMLCNTGSIVVAYKRPVVISAVNVGDVTTLGGIGYVVSPGFRITFDTRPLDD